MYIKLLLAAWLAICQHQVFGSVISRGAEDNDVCDSEECHNTANHILKWLNPEADPCVDFYDFVCGNWKNLPVNERANMSLGARDSLAEHYMPLLLKDPSATNGNKHFENLRNFMITCMDEDTIKSVGVTPIKQLIQKAGGWPVLGADWSEDDWDFLNAELTLGGVLIDVETSYYTPENESDVTFILEVTQSSLIRRYSPSYYNLIKGLEDNTTKLYFNNMVDVAVVLGADRVVAEQEMKEVLEFETAFIEELRNANYSNDDEAIKLQEFQEAVPWIDLTKLCEAYLPASYNVLPEEKMIGEKEFFIILEKFLDQYPLKTVVNYIVSKAVYPLMDYVHHGLSISPEVDYEYETEEENESRFNYCSKKVQGGSLGPAMAAYLGLQYTDASKVATEMTRVIIAELSKEVEESDWLDKITRVEAAKNISDIEIDVGFPAKITDLNELDKLYEGYEIDTSNFFDAILYDKKWVKQREFDRLHKTLNGEANEMEQLGWKYFTFKGLAVNAHFIPGQNIIDVSGPMLYFTPLFSPENPAYVNYGHAGTIVAHELIHAVDLNAAPEDDMDLLEMDLLEMERWGDNQTENIYNEKKQCFIDFYSTFNDSTTAQQLNGTNTNREDMADNGGLKLSLRAYRKYAKQLDAPERKLPRLTQYTIEQLFMISVANAYCEIPDELKLLNQLRYDVHSPFEFRVKGIMMNSPGFSEIFNCDKKDPMNPPDKCEVW